MIIQNIINKTKHLFPESAEFRDSENKPEYQIISWKLGDDVNRPNKHSIPIHLALSDEFIEDYNDGNEKIKARMIEDAIKFIQKHIEEFNPAHNTPRDQIVREVKWIVPTLN